MLSRSVVSDFLPPFGVLPTRCPVHGIFQARILEWVAMLSSWGSSRPRARTHVSCIFSIASGSFPTQPSGRPSSHCWSRYNACYVPAVIPNVINICPKQFTNRNIFNSCNTLVRYYYYYLPDPRTKRGSPTLQADASLFGLPGKPTIMINSSNFPILQMKKLRYGEEK